MFKVNYKKGLPYRDQEEYPRQREYDLYGRKKKCIKTKGHKMKKSHRTVRRSSLYGKI